MKRVGLVIGCWMGGGCEVVVGNLAEELTALGYKVDIICLSEPTHPNESNKVKLHYVKLVKPSKGVWYRILNIFSQFKILSLNYPIHKRMHQLQHADNIRILKEYIRELGDFDLIISNLKVADYLCIAAEFSNHYVCMHGSYEGLAFHRKQIYSGVNIIAISEKSKEEILDSGILPISIQTIHNIFNFEEIRAKSNEYKVIDKDYVVFVGRLNLLKQIPILIDAYISSEIKQNLIIIGDGELQKHIQQIIKSKGVEKRVLLKGYLSNPYPYIKNAKALALSSRIESLPTVLIEALILGTPIVSTDCSGPKEIMQDELADFLSPIGNVEALARNLQKVISNPPQIKNKHIARFSREINLPKYIALIND